MHPQDCLGIGHPHGLLLKQLGWAFYLRVDTVHQGNRDGQSGPFHINAVDTVTQWQVVGCVVALLAAVDAAHEDLSGPAVRHILRREYKIWLLLSRR